MSFRIFATGTENFHYTRDNCADNDIFEAAEVMSALQGLEPSASGVAQGVAEYLSPSMEGVRSSGIASIASGEMVHLLTNAVTMLATCTGARQGWISVAPRTSHFLRAETSRYARYNFSPGREPALEFMRMILPVLTATDMNNYGVLREMAIALSRYYAHIGNSGTPMIQIELSK